MNDTIDEAPAFHGLRIKGLGPRRRKIGEWSPAHPSPKVVRVPAFPKDEADEPTFAVDAEGNPRRFEPDHVTRAVRRSPAARAFLRGLRRAARQKRRELAERRLAAA